jgi:hypothetical protein
VNAEIPPAPVPLRSAFTFPTVKPGTAGTLALTFANLAAGKLAISCTTKLTRLVRVHHGHHARRVRKQETIGYCSRSVTRTSAGRLALTLAPSGHGLSLVRSRKHLTVQLSITFTQPGDLPDTQTHTITVPYRAPKPRRG